MEKCISHLLELVEEFEKILARITQSPKTEEPIDALKKEAIHIEGQISQGIENLRHEVRINDSIPTEERENQLNIILNENGINLSQLRIRRRAAVNEVNKALAEMKAQERIEARQRLLGESTKSEISRAINMKNQNSLALATDATARLERTRNIIRAQVQESQNSIELMRESTEFLEGINDATSKVESAQNKATRSLIRLRIAQNFDRYLLKFSIFIFICSVIFVIHSNLTHNVFVDIVKFGYRTLKKKTSANQKATGTTFTYTPTPTSTIEESKLYTIKPTPTSTMEESLVHMAEPTPESILKRDPMSTIEPTLASTGEPIDSANGGEL